MNSSPAFQFYPDDFLAGTVGMSCAERGLYITLLCIQWSRGTVSEEEIARLGGGMAPPERCFVMSKFVQVEEGRYQNARLEKERGKQAEYKAKQSENGKLGAKSKHRQSTAIATPQHRHSDATAPLDSGPGEGLAKSSSPSPSPSSLVLSPTGGSSDGDSDGGEGENPPGPDYPEAEVPSLEECLQWAASAGVDPEWTRKKWITTDANNGWERNGRPVKWRSLWKLWFDEDRRTGRWLPGDATPKTASQNATPIWRQIEALKQAIREHRANPDSGCDQAFATAEDWKDLKAKRAKLRELEAQKKAADEDGV